MSLKRIMLPIMAALGLCACGTSSLQTRLEQLESDRQDLARRNNELTTECTALRARCDSLDKALTDLQNRPVAAPAEDLGDGISVKRGQRGETVINIPSDIFFRSGVSTLSKSGSEALTRVAEYIRKNHAGSMMRIEGHADTDPINKTKSKYHCNWHLSMERAHSVVHYLVDKQNFDPKSICMSGYGSFHPQDAKDKAKNRRVEIVVLP